MSSELVYTATDRLVRIQLFRCCIAEKACRVAKYMRQGSQNLRQCAYDLKILLLYKDALCKFLAEQDEVIASGLISLTGGNSGTITARVNGRAISAAVPYNSSLGTTASDLAISINATTSSPQYSAAYSGGQDITINGPEGYGARINAHQVTTLTTGTLTATTVDMYGGITEIEEEDNYSTQELVDTMWDKVSKKCKICFAPYSTTYTE